MMDLRRRLDRLEAFRDDPDRCPGGFTLILPDNGRGDAPEDAACCPRCGDVHVLIVTEAVIELE